MSCLWLAVFVSLTIIEASVTKPGIIYASLGNGVRVIVFVGQEQIHSMIHPDRLHIVASRLLMHLDTCCIYICFVWVFFHIHECS